MAKQSAADREAEERAAMEAANARKAKRDALAASWRGQQFAGQGFAPEATLALVAWRTDHHVTAKMLRDGRTHLQIIHTVAPLDADLPVEDDVDEFVAAVTAGSPVPDEAWANAPEPPAPDAWRDYHGNA